MSGSSGPGTDIYLIGELEGRCLILDANALLSPFQMGFNLDIEIERAVPGVKPVVPSSVVSELETLSKKGDWRTRAALKLCRKYPVIEVKGRGDSPIFNLAVRKGWIVMTQDRGLRASLKKKGIPVVVIRGKGHLQLLGP